MLQQPQTYYEQSTGKRWGLALLVGLLATLPFWGGLSNTFVWDDEMNVVNNQAIQHLNSETLEWMFTETHGGHYHPLTWLSLALNYHFSGLHAAPYIATNILMHGTCAMLLYLLICQLLTPLVAGKSMAHQFLIFGVATLFWALHPLRVESVVWVTERRDVLSGMFILASVLAYTHYVKSPSRKHLWYALCVVAAGMSLLSKAWAITLPVILLTLDVYPLKRKFQLGVLVEKIPFMLLSLAFGLRALGAQSVEALASLQSHGTLDRIAQVLYNLGFLPAKTLLPANLSPLYLLKPEFSLTNPWVIVSAVAVTIITAACAGLAFKYKRPAPLITWISAIIIILPVSGIAQSGSQITADRYTYLAAIPFSLLLAAAIQLLYKRFGAVRTTIPAALILLALTAVSSKQVPIWKDPYSLWTHALKQDPTNYVAYYNRATAGRDNADVQGQYDDLTEAIRYNPRYAGAYNNRGRILLHASKPHKALDDFRKAASFNPRLAEPHVNIGAIHLQHLNNPEQAYAAFQQALKLEPRNYAALSNLGLLHQKQGDLTTAITYHQKALQSNNNDGLVWLNLGLCHLELGQLKDASRTLNHASKLAPKQPECWYALGKLHLKQNKPKEAAKALKQALETAPEHWHLIKDTKRLLKIAETKP